MKTMGKVLILAVALILAESGFSQSWPPGGTTTTPTKPNKPNKPVKAHPNAGKRVFILNFFMYTVYYLHVINGTKTL